MTAVLTIKIGRSWVDSWVKVEVRRDKLKKAFMRTLEKHYVGDVFGECKTQGREAGIR